MYDFLYESLPDPSRYLRRIGIYEDTLSLTKETLDRLIYAHLTHIPFENLDIYDGGRELCLAPSALFEKVVVHQRGGYCFELNALFCQLLRELGFSVYPVAARVAWRKDHFPPLSHRMSIVVIEGEKYVCDVGFGGPAPAGALALGDDAVQSICGESFSITHEAGVYTIRRLCPKGSERLLMFADSAVDPVDFFTLNHFFSTHPMSAFLISRRVNLRTAEGNFSLFDCTMKQNTGNSQRETVFSNEAALREALRTHFHLSYDLPLRV